MNEYGQSAGGRGRGWGQGQWHAYQCEFDDRVVGQIDRSTHVGAIFFWLGEDSNGLYLPVTEVIQACTQVSHCMD